MWRTMARHASNGRAVSALTSNGAPATRPFELNASFIESYRDKRPAFGFNGLGEFVYYRTYARRLDDGRLESWCALLCWAGLSVFLT